MTVCIGGALLAAVSATGVIVDSAPAFADTGAVTYACSTGIGTVSILVDVTGTITPAVVVSGETFNLTGYQAQITIPAPLATTLVNDGVTRLEGTTGAVVNATNATPSSVTPTFTWSTTLTSGQTDTFDAPSSGPITLGPFTATSTNPPAVLTAGTQSTSVVVNGGTSSATCSPPGNPVIASAASFSFTTTPSATSIVAGTPGGVSDTATLAGNSTDGAPGGDVTFYLCQSPGTCPPGSGGVTVGTGDVVGDTSSASANFAVPSTTGDYCFYASYPGAGSYPPATDNSPSECFTVTAPIPCAAATSCGGSVSSTAGTVTVSGTSSTTGNLYLQVGQAAESCPLGYNTPAPFTTLQETDFASSAPLTLTDTVVGVPTTKQFGVCFQTLQGTFKDKAKQQATTGLLPNCKKRKPVAPCLQSATEAGGDVLATLLVPPNDPRFHAGGATPVAVSVSPSSGAPGAKLTISGLYLKGATVFVGSVQVPAKASAKKIKLTVPRVTLGIVPITITTATGTTVIQSFRVT